MNFKDLLKINFILWTIVGALLIQYRDNVQDSNYKVGSIGSSSQSEQSYYEIEDPSYEQESTPATNAMDQQLQEFDPHLH